MREVSTLKALMKEKQNEFSHYIETIYNLDGLLLISRINLLEGLNDKKERIIQSADKKIFKSKGFKMGIIIFIIAVLLLAYTFIEPYWLKTTEYTIYNENLPEEFDGYKIIFISDIHHGPFFSYERVEKLKQRINAMDRDLVLMGGDYVHRGPAYVPIFFEAITGLNAPDGVMGVLGNHDHWDGEKATRDGFATAGIIDLENIGVPIEKEGAQIHIRGVGDLDEGVQNFEPAQDVFTVLVSHNPDYIMQLGDQKPDLMLCGHTHGGQVTLFGIWAPLIPSSYGNKFRYGHIPHEGIDLIVTSGVGTVTPPVRFFARPEIVVITLKVAK